jgi:predicted RNA-binding Zn-ribbon protein involved in translation (DUF1610 family)
MSDEDILAYNLFGEGEKGDAHYSTLTNKMVVTRQPRDCIVCRDAIPIGARARVVRERWGREFGTFYSCPTCCAAMAASWTDNGKAMVERYTAAAKRPRP